MFAFFQEFSQGGFSPDSYDADLHELFDKFFLSGNSLSMSVQVMIMVCGLQGEYGKVLLNFMEDQKKFDTEDLESITA